MTKKEAQNIADLQIEVTPLIEDAFYAFREIDCKELDARLNRLSDNYVRGDAETDKLMEKYLNDIDIAEKARERLMLIGPAKRANAIATAFKMIENQEKYGYPCLEWWPD